MELSPQRIRKILKKKDWRWKRTKTSLKGKQKPEEKLLKKGDLATLKLYEEEGAIKIKYLDEAGFCLWSPVSYSDIKKGKQKEIKQSLRRGRRVSILGIYSADSGFDYGLKLGGFKNKTYIEFLNWQAEKAEKDWQETGKITVIVLDNYTVHKSKEVKKYEEKWREQGLEFFFISAYSPELNLIEAQWHQLKTHELAGRMFEDEYDLAMAIIKGDTLNVDKQGQPQKSESYGREKSLTTGCPCLSSLFPGGENRQATHHCTGERLRFK